MMNKIIDDVPDEVLAALAEGCGFSVTFDHSPGADEWTLSAGHGTSHVQHSGSRRSVCAFLIGYSTMQIQTTQVLNDLDRAHRSLIDVMRTRLGR